MQNIKGMTLIELLISIAIMGVLASMALPLAENEVKRIREKELKYTLLKMRSAIDRFYDLKNREKPDLSEEDKYPKTLQELVEKKILRKMPVDPITGKEEWKLISSTDFNLEQNSDNRNLFDVRSLATETARDGSLYREW